MEYIEKRYLDIEDVDKTGITFKNGEKIIFKECIKQRYNSETCVAERDLFAKPPYFVFFTSGRYTKVIFNKKGFFSKSNNRNDFRKLQMVIIELGYSSYDLS